MAGPGCGAAPASAGAAKPQAASVEFQVLQKLVLLFSQVRVRADVAKFRHRGGAAEAGGAAISKNNASDAARGAGRALRRAATAA